MRPDRDDALAWEARWSRPVALATFAAVGLLVAATVIYRSIGGDSDAEALRLIDERSSTVIASGIMQAVGFLLLAAPLVYLFRAAQARSERVRGQLIGLAVAAPIFLAASAFLTSVAATDAASDFQAGRATADLTRADATEECRQQRSDDRSSFREDFGTGSGAVQRCAGSRVADDEAENAVADATVRQIGLGFGLGGRLGLAVILLYGCLWAMRVGLLTRFWGSLGMAMGAAALLLLLEFTLVWFFYFALLAAGWVPGGRPPAWETGEAIPWPTPGEKAAEGMGSGDDDEPDAGEATEVGEPERLKSGERRKRKQRD
jgi:hypothetical protein